MMNELIEQLGGYEASKNILLRKRYDHVSYSVDSDSFYDHEAAEHGAIDIQELDDALLEYRREHNIFEVGDFVVDDQHTGLLKVTRVMKKRLDVDYLNPQVMNVICHSSILIRHIKHAADAEIEAGYRL